MVIDRYGNTSSASIPLALVDALETGRLQTGHHVLLTGFGGGHDLGQCRAALGRMTAGRWPRHWWCWPPAWPAGTAAASRWPRSAPTARRSSTCWSATRWPPGSAGSCWSSTPRPDRPSATTSSGAGRSRWKWPSPSSGCPWGPCTRCWRPRTQLGADRAFAVSNADDVYGEIAMGLLAGQLGAGRRRARPGRLPACGPPWPPTTRSPGGSARSDERGYLAALTERRQVTRHDGGRPLHRPRTGSHPVDLDGDLPTSVNLWGFQPAIWDVLESAMDASGLDEEAAAGRGGRRRRGTQGRGPAPRGGGDHGGRRVPACRCGWSPPTPSWWASPMPPTCRWSAPNWPARWPGEPGRANCGEADRHQSPTG